MLVTSEQVSRINAHVDVSSMAGGLVFDLSLHPHPYFMYATSEGSGRSAHIRVNFSNKCSCLGVQWGLKSSFWSESSTTTILHVYKPLLLD